MFDSIDNLFIGLFGAALLYVGFALLVGYYVGDKNVDKRQATFNAIAGMCAFIGGLRILDYWFSL